VITSRRHDIVKHFRRVSHGDEGLVLLDGWHLLRDADAAGFKVSEVAIAGDATEGGANELLARLRQKGTRLWRVSASVMDAMSPVRTPSGVVAVAERPLIPWPALLVPAPALVVVTVDVQDPGNLGATIRAAEASGATGVLATGNTANPWSWRALRAGMGSTFRLPVVCRENAVAACEALADHGLHVAAAVPRGGRSVYDTDLCGATAVLIGGEGAGLDRSVLERAEAITVPMAPGVESLNVAVACGVLLYEAFRQRHHATYARARAVEQQADSRG
jgi:RNA methyltransferase, TrmH family